jgi:hypothetical protein
MYNDSLRYFKKGEKAMDFYEATFFGHDDGDDGITVRLEHHEPSVWPFKIKIVDKGGNIIVFHIATMLELFEFVQSVNESYEELMKS